MRASILLGLSTLTASLAVVAPRAPVPQSSLGLFEGEADVGQVTKRGSVTYDADRDQYTIAGSGANMWLDHDDFHFLWKRIQGNFILTARARFNGPGVEPHRKFGWSVRSSLASGSPHVTAAVHGDGLVALQFRRSAGGATEEFRSPASEADVVQLERKGDTYVLSVARFGDSLTAVQVADLPLGNQVYVGLFVCAHNDTVVERATFRDVRITAPAPEGFVPYRDYIGSNLEILDVASGDRTIVYRSRESLQAPNWTKDGKALIYNSQGLIYRFDLVDRRPVAVNTAFATQNNNDHVLSFDGRTLGISHHSPDDHNASIVYTVPVEGGTPRRVTSRGPSYLHGWSPDGRFLVYTGERGGEFDVYRISAEGGEETRLTSAPGLDDGPEYSPDGKYIYFNSVRSGTMQIWRMRADGSAQEQITSDQYHNWFPHVSPDGQWIVFLSFMKDVAPSDHPFYKHVYLRLMPAQGTGAEGAAPPRVVGYVYGGQGTINVPSWSPDSRRIAFVSNSDLRRLP
jgi:dipeptidyl aminopeptidase/acylaminoacyl peptidase